MFENEELLSLIHSENFDQLEEFLESLPIERRTRIISRLTGEHQLELLTGIDAELAADIVHALPEVQSIEAIANMPAKNAVQILENLDSDERADIVGDLDSDEAEAILNAMSPQASASLRRLVEYDDEVAGGLMTNEFLAFSGAQTVDSVVGQMRRNAETYSDFQIQWLGLVIGSAMMLNTVLAVSIGGTLPLIMRLCRLDPALASGPILTTITDMFGFMLVLSLATLFLDRLV